MLNSILALPQDDEPQYGSPNLQDLVSLCPEDSAEHCENLIFDILLYKYSKTNTQSIDYLPNVISGEYMNSNEVPSESILNSNPTISEVLEYCRGWFWIIFIILPMFTGILAYHWLPNESFNDNNYIMIQSTMVEGPGGQVGEKALVWQHKTTGQIYTFDSFKHHRNKESIRMFFAWFAYGAIGCMYFAFDISKMYAKRFFNLLLKSIIINIIIAYLTMISIKG